MPTWEIKRADDHAPPDFEYEDNLKRFIRPSRWIAVNIGNFRLLRINVRAASPTFLL